MSYEIIDTIVVSVLHDFDKYDRLNLIKIKIVGNKKKRVRKNVLSFEIQIWKW